MQSRNLPVSCALLQVPAPAPQQHKCKVLLSCEGYGLHLKKRTSWFTSRKRATHTGQQLGGMGGQLCQCSQQATQLGQSIQNVCQCGSMHARWVELCLQGCCRDKKLQLGPYGRIHQNAM